MRRLRTIRREIRTHPSDTTISITHATVRIGSLRNSSSGSLAWAKTSGDMSMEGYSFPTTPLFSCEDGSVDASEAKRARLEEILTDLDRVLVAYSGGVDSAFLMAVAHEVLGPRALAVTAVSPSLARRELDGATVLARRFGWDHEVVATHEVAREEYARNDTDRCYWCKDTLFDVLRPRAAVLGAVVVTGTNVDDLGDHRPGLRAAVEHEVRAPLAEAGLSKAEIRSLSQRLGLPTAEKPASPCLSSRFAYGVRVTPQGLRRIERAEEAVRGFGFRVLRVRDLGDSARIEIAEEELPRAVALEPQLVGAVAAAGFGDVALSPDPFRSGSLNRVLATPGFGPPVP